MFKYYYENNDSSVIFMNVKNQLLWLFYGQSEKYRVRKGGERYT